MTTYRKLRELVTLSRGLRAEARRLPRGSQGRTDRERRADSYRVQAFWLAGRVTDAAYAEYLRTA